MRPIQSLMEFKKMPLVIALNHQQSEEDNKDSEILTHNFTRSPLHAIQFLIIYAGLTNDQRSYVLKALNNPVVTHDALDQLILNSDWPQILSSKNQNALKFEFIIEIANKDYFLNAVKTKCVRLFHALTKNIVLLR